LIPPLTVCSTTYGDSIGRGSFTFIKGAWNKIQQTITLNTLGHKNGKIQVKFNGNQVIYYDKMAWQGHKSIPFIGLDFATFFGGHDPSWATPITQHAFFRKFYIYYS